LFCTPQNFWVNKNKTAVLNFVDAARKFADFFPKWEKIIVTNPRGETRAKIKCLQCQMSHLMPKMPKNAKKCPKMPKNATKCQKMTKNAQKCQKMPKMPEPKCLKCQLSRPSNESNDLKFFINRDFFHNSNFIKMSFNLKYLKNLTFQK
jgi:hypothetical protein